MGKNNEQQIFYDPKKTRWKRLSLVFFIIFIFLEIILGISLVSIIKEPLLPDRDINDSLKVNESVTAYYKESKQKVVKVKESILNKILGIKELSAAEKENAKNKKSPKVIAFYTNWDDNSFTSLQQNINEIDQIIPEWIHLNDENGNVIINNIEIQDKVTNYIRRVKPEVLITPILTNFNPKTKTWDNEMLEKMLKNPDARKNTIKNISNIITENGFSGVSVDFENISSEGRGNLTLFMQELYEMFKLWKLEVSQNIPLADDNYDPAVLSKYNDFIILMAYDQHTPDATLPGPIASQSWYEESLKHRFSQLDPSKYIIALGSYGYDWTDNIKSDDQTTFQEAIGFAIESNKSIDFDKTEMNPTFKFTDKLNKKHHIWFLDAVTVFNQISFADKYKPHGYALWRLGSEDPAIWKIFENRGKTHQQVAEELRKMSYGYDLDYRGKGEILKVFATPSEGEREIEYDKKTKYIISEKIKKYPTPYIIHRYGGNNKKKIVLTFDDGPDKEYTPKILDILKEYDVKATFFIIGSKAMKNTDIIRRIVEEGHEIGNHTFTHPNISLISKTQVKLELNSTQRLLEGMINKHTTLFRPPYGEAIEPVFPNEMNPLVLTSKLGYYSVGMKIDPKDFSNPEPELIVQNVVKGAMKNNGSIVLLHDGGGERSNVIKALPSIISHLKKRGYEFTTVAGLLSADETKIMPTVSKSSVVTIISNKLSFQITGKVLIGIYLLFIFGIIMNFSRAIFIIVMSFVQVIKRKKIKNGFSRENFQPRVSIVIAALNEEKVIVATVNSLLRSSYSNFEIIFINDGSEDSTLGKVSENFSNNRKVRIFSIPNRGKAEALNYGIEKSNADIIITLDADTYFKTDTVWKLVRNFQNPKIGAVAGNAKVGNRINFLTKTQALEYITSQNLDRRAFDAINCIAVVPGAVGAWRRSVLISVNGFSSQTLAEDADLTFAIILEGYQVVYESQAIGLTEAPDTIRDFMTQRFRWMYGMLQTAWKYKHTFMRYKHGALGMVAMPNILIFQILFALIAPLMDIVLVFSIIWIGWQGYQHPEDYLIVQNMKNIVLYYLIFTATEIFIALTGFILEWKENKKLLLWVIPQRFFYRQILYVVAIKIVYTALKGVLVGWKRVDRKATVQMKMSEDLKNA